MKLKHVTLATAFALAACNFAAPAQAQDAQAVAQAICARPDLPPPTRIVCASPGLKANWVRNLAAAIEVGRKLSRVDLATLKQRIGGAARQHAAYCHADAPNPQLPPSTAMETCLGYWQDRTFADLQTLDQRIAQASANQAVGDFFQGLGTVLGAVLDAAGTVAEYEYALRPAQPRQSRTFCQGYGVQNGTASYYCW